MSAKVYCQGWTAHGGKDMHDTKAMAMFACSAAYWADLETILTEIHDSGMVVDEQLYFYGTDGISSVAPKTKVHTFFNGAADVRNTLVREGKDISDGEYADLVDMLGYKPDLLGDPHPFVFCGFGPSIVDIHQWYAYGIEHDVEFSRYIEDKYGS